MRTLFDTEEEELESKQSEITLSLASLLGIFFGLVLICGVFFGFGYSMGRGSGSQAKVLENPPASNTGDADETAAAQNPPAPAAAPVPPKQQSPKQQDDQNDQQDAQQDAGKAIAKAAPAPVVKNAPEEAAAKPVFSGISKPAPGREPAPYSPPTDEPPTATGKPMVQIAAVARLEDANVLVTALRQRGFGVVVHTEPQDKLFHVQMGPFADRGQAAAMKQKLLSDGYNAIIKE
jgi:DedD protein